MTNNSLKLKHGIINCVNSIRANSFKILKEVEADKMVSLEHLENIEDTLARLTRLVKESANNKTLTFPFVSSSIDSNE
jgi:hypothetical protein